MHECALVPHPLDAGGERVPGTSTRVARPVDDNVLGPNAHEHSSGPSLTHGDESHIAYGYVNEPIARCNDLSLHNCLHTEQTRDLGIRRATEYVGEETALPYGAVDQHGHTISERERIASIMRDKNSRGMKRDERLPELLTYPFSHDDIERGERLVEQEQTGPRRECSG